MLKKLPKTFTKKKYVFILFIFMSWFVISACFLLMDYVYKRHKLMNYAQETVQVFNSIFEHANSSIDLAEKIDYLDCDKSLNLLRQIAAVTPYVRSIVILHNNKLVCNSVLGKTDFPVDINLKHKRLAIVDKSYITKKPVLILTKKINENTEIRIGINTYFLSHNLLSGSEDRELYIEIDDTIYNLDGVAKSLDISDGYIRATSQAYPFSIYVNDSFVLTSLDVKFILFMLFAGVIVGGYGNRIFSKTDFVKYELENAILNNEIKPYIQPISSSNGNVIGGEVLARWVKGNDRVIPPSVFIPLIEQYDLMESMTNSMLDQLINTPKLLNSNKQLHLSINVTKECLENEMIHIKCEWLAEQCCLILELTESKEFTDPETISLLMSQLREQGVLFALDDYGTGFSTLKYLKQYQFDYLKIDKMFVDNVCNDSVSREIIKNIIALAKKLNINLVAEGVEHQCQVNKLANYGVDYFQGYYFSKPITVDDFIAKYILQ
ncbi:EAL domain-containing protein [Photobacterium damselae]|uniref:EAL domain-containing protein n=1 Tax=Photobacterium damselae TaxID=38293 RepID=UPI0012AE1B31|nr:EAL domain-containing protein [Photobacterium damselae]